MIKFIKFILEKLLKIVVTLEEKRATKRRKLHEERLARFVPLSFEERQEVKRKNKRKRVKKARILRAISICLIWLGVLLIIGTAGSSDTGYISFTQAIKMLSVGICIFACGAGLTWSFTTVIQNHMYEERRK